MKNAPRFARCRSVDDGASIGGASDNDNDTDNDTDIDNGIHNNEFQLELNETTFSKNLTAKGLPPNTSLLSIEIDVDNPKTKTTTKTTTKTKTKSRSSSVASETNNVTPIMQSRRNIITNIKVSERALMKTIIRATTKLITALAPSSLGADQPIHWQLRQQPNARDVGQ